MNPIPEVWEKCIENPFKKRMALEAQNRFRQFASIPCETLEEWESFREELRERLWEKLGSTYDRTLPVDYKEYGSIDCGSYSIKKITYRSTKEMLVTANLFIPAGEGPFPAVVALHGHWAQGKIAERVQCRSHLLAANGYVVIAVDAFGSGERGSVQGKFEYHGGALGSSLLNIGESLMGCQIRDNMRAVDLLCSLPFVDREKIGVTGASGGGNQTMWLAAMDDRIKASAPVVSVGNFESYVEERNCICELLVDGLTFTEESAVLALAAPHAMLIMNAMDDCNKAFYPKEMLRSYHYAKKIFALYERESAFAYKIFDTTHGYWPPMREEMLGFFNYHLKGEGACLPVKECAYQCLPEKELLVFPEGTLRDPEVLSIAEYCRIKGEALCRTERKVSAEDLQSLLRIKTSLTVESFRFLGRKDNWDKYTVTFSDGTQMPLVIRKGGSDFLFLTHPEGKNAVTLPEEKEATLVAADFIFQGENGYQKDPVIPFHDETRQLLWLGRSLMGEWVNALNALILFLRKEFTVKTLTVEGTAEMAVAGLFASILNPGKVDFLVLKEAPASFLFAGKDSPAFYNMALFLPGLLARTDMELLVKASEASVQWISPRNMDGTPYEGKK